MAESITFSIEGERELIAKFDRLPSASREKLRAAVVDSQYQLQGIIRGLLSGDPLHVRSGLLRNSIAVQPLVESGDSISGSVTANTPYAAIHEFGGEIHPRSAGALTIPTDAVLTAGGVPRYTAREIFDNPSIGGFTHVFMRNGIIFGVDAGRSLTPLFILKVSVTMPARPYMSRGLDMARPAIEARMREALAEAAA